MLVFLQTVTNESVLLWAKRAYEDFKKKVAKTATAKQKARGSQVLSGSFKLNLRFPTPASEAGTI